MNITIIDALMGTGKTRYIFNLMNGNPGDKYIYIGVNLGETERCQQACIKLDMHDPVPLHGRKYWDLQLLVVDGHNIASTHQLFRYMDTALFNILMVQREYILIIDEAMEVVSLYKDAPDDMKALFAAKMIYVDDKKCIRWNHKEFPDYVKNNKDGVWKEFRSLCDNGNLVMTRDGILLWKFPASYLSAFKHVYICTYMFEGQDMANYFKAYGVPYQLMTILDGRLIAYNSHDNTAQKEALAANIKIDLDPYRNAVGKKNGHGYPLTETWFNYRIRRNVSESAKRDIKRLANSTAAFFKEYGESGHKNMWTVFKPYRSKVKGPRYGRKECFVPMNTKATDKLKHNTTVAYLVDRWQSPLIAAFFDDMGIATRDDLFALTELIQWVWRSAIRENQPIQLYLPSERMRTILVNWIRYSDADIVNGQRLDRKGAE